MPPKFTSFYDVSDDENFHPLPTKLATKLPPSNTELAQRISDLEQTVEELTIALNESRDHIQSLLDFCFVDKTAWKEGQIVDKGS
jgi:hypothetical protein